jgi:hypothetical protein
MISLESPPAAAGGLVPHAAILMAKPKPHHTLADYVAIAISPALIMAMVSSLIFFLLAVIYDGDFLDRLRWVFFWYVFGTVLVARLSMETGMAERAPLYGLVLAGLTWVALFLYIDYPAGMRPIGAVVSLGLIGLIWWSTYRLTWDCTYIDDNIEQSGQGLLQAVGLEDSAQRVEVTEDAATKRLGWWERYQRYRAERNKKHSPGVWVVYFSLAAFPIFGLGQSLIDVEDVDRRRHVFWLMGIYVGSGLGLLLTTSFLGLRRYLRQRNLQMPVKMTSAWLGVGTVMVLALLVAAALLPRPDSETSLFALTKLGGERNASKYNLKDGNPGKGEGNPSSQPPKDNQPGKPGSDGQKDPKGGDPAKGNSGQGGSGEKGNSRSGDKQNSSSGGNKSDDQSKGSKSEPGDKKGDPSQNPKGDKAKQDDQAKGSSGDSSSDKSESQQSKSQSSTSNSRTWAKSLVIPHSVGSVLKWIVFGVLAIVVVVVLLRQGLGFLANFTDWAKNLLNALRAFWARLFGGGKTAAEHEPIIVEEPGQRPRPFSAFHNPFLDGRSKRLSPQDLVRYSFAALQAWAWERSLGRAADETPLEFANRLGHELPALEADARKLSLLYARVTYARGSLPTDSADSVERFWTQLEAMVEQPMSA